MNPTTSAELLTELVEEKIEIQPPAESAVLRCSRCLYDEKTPAISFDNQGVCNYCKVHDEMNAEYPTGKTGEQILQKLAGQIRQEGKGKPFDVIVGVSGGADSSFMIYKAKELGLRPLAVHFDNTWNSKIAVENIHNILKKLDVELFTYVVDNEEYDDILRAFILAGVPEVDGATDIGLATTLYLAASKYKINYMFEGHSFRTEGVSPLGWVYIDGKYIQSIVKKYGNYKSHKLKSFPNLWLSKFIKWMAFNRIKKIRPLYYMDYQKEEAKQFLAQEFGWQWYGGHHLENRFTAFNHYLLNRRFGADTRLLGYSAHVRSGQMTRAEGLALLAKPFNIDPEIIDMVKKRLNFSDVEFQRVMEQPKRSYKEFKTYKQTFERMRPFFWLMYKLDLVPKSFYLKYTSKNNL